MLVVGVGVNRLSRKKLYLLIALVGSVLIGAMFCFRYQHNIEAALWHRAHGNYVAIGEHRMMVPPLWWEGEPEIPNQTMLVRVHLSGDDSEPKIGVMGTGPGKVTHTDEDELQLVRAMVNSSNLKPQPEWTHSLVSLSGKKFNWYCIRSDLFILNANISTTLNCYTASLPYALDYSGPPALEKEAESIFQGIE